MADTTQVNAAPDNKTDLTNMVSPTESAGAIDGASPQSPLEPVNGTSPGNHHPKNDLPTTNGNGVITPSDEKKTPTGFKSPPKQDPIKQKEREERVKMLREKQAEEQKKKLDELKEAQRRAQDIREKQLQERQKKILEQRRREEQHRALVEERRKRMISEENEKRVALLKKNADRESKLEAARQKLLTVGPAPDKRLSLSTSHLSPAKGKRLTRHSLGTAGSSINLRATSLSSTNVAPSKGPSPKKTRLSGSTSNLGSATVPGESRMKPAASTTSLIAAKNRSKSADVSTMRVSRSSQDIKRSIDRLSAPRVPRESRDRSAPNRPAPKTPSTPPVKLQPAVPRALPRETNKAMAPKEKNKQPAPQKGPVKANHNVNVSTVTKASKPSTPKRSTPSPKTGSPVKERVTPPGTSPAVSPPPAASPVPGEEKKDEEKKVDRAEENKNKLAAKRKEMREKAEREAEEKRLREEEERRLEEERIVREEEEERKRIVEEERLAAEARKAEEERLQKAIEEAEKRRKEEEERAEDERQAKEESDRLAKEEAEKKEVERVEKLRKEEEERQERRKRLEMIMNRVRPDQEKSDSPSPTKSASPPSATTPDRELPPTNVMTASGSFKSPLLQQMMSKKAQAEIGQEQAGESDAESAPADDLLVQAEPEVETAVALETPDAVEEATVVADVGAGEPAVVEQPAEPVPEEKAAVETVAIPEAVAEPTQEPEAQEEAAEPKEENVAQEVVTSAIEEAVAEVGQPVANGEVESHEAPHSDNSSPAKGSPAPSPRDSNNTSTSVSLDVSPNSSAPASPRREGASSADEGAAEKVERSISPDLDDDTPKFKSPLLQRMIGNKDKSATKALEEVRKKGDSDTSSTSSSPVPPKEEQEAEQSAPEQLNSDIAELNQVSVEISGDSVAKDSIPTLNGVNHTAEDLNEVSTSICDVNQKKEDISELWKNSVGDVQAAF